MRFESLQCGIDGCVDVKATAFPFEFDSDEFGTSPQSLSPASSVDLSVSSMSMEEMSEMQEWMSSGSVTTTKSSPVQEDAGMPGLSDGGLNGTETATPEAKDTFQLPTSETTPQMSPQLEGMTLRHA